MKRFSFLFVLLSACGAATTALPPVPPKPEIACKATPAQADVMLHVDPDKPITCGELDEHECQLALDFVWRCKESMRYWHSK